MQHMHAPWRRALPLVVLGATQYLLILDSAIVNVALASIGDDLGVSPADLTWVVNAYVLAFGGLLLLGGRLSDVLGAKSMFTCGVVLFVAASAAGAAATQPGWLVLARSAQGMGAALAAPALLALTIRMYEDGPARHRALGVLGAMAGAGGASGLLLGGVLTEAWGWRSVLWLNVPLGLGIAALGGKVLARPSAPGPRPRFDLAGAVASTAGLTVLVYGVLGTGVHGWWSPRTGLTALVGITLLAAFVRIERRAPQPLLPLDFLRARPVLGANLAAATTAAAMFPMWFLVTLFAQQVLGFGPLEAGVAVLPLSMVLIATNTVAPRVIAAAGTRTPVVGGLVLGGVGLAWFARLDVTGSPAWIVLPPSLVTGIGLGLAFAGSLASATSQVPAHRSGLAGGVVNAAQQLGGALSLAVLLTLATARTDGLEGRMPVAVALGEGFRSGLAGAASIALIGALLAAVTMTSPRPATRRGGARGRSMTPSSP